MSEEKKALFIIFGGTGDLARRKLYPSLFLLFKKGYLKNSFAVIGTARREWTDEYYQSIVIESIQNIASSQKQAEDFASHFRYQSHNVKDTTHYDKLKLLGEQLDKEYEIGGNRLFYLSMSPSFFGLIAQNLNSQGLKTTNGFNRLIIEKPFGENYRSAEELNEQLQQSFDEKQIYRIDHYLGKEMVQSIPAVRFGNPLIQKIWNKEFIKNIQITLSESLGVEERGGYYDHTGALKDMVQNHVLQLVALLSMEAPSKWEPEEIRKQKVAALEAIQKPSAEEVEKDFVRGQYTSETDDMKGYLEEEQIETDSKTETFAAGKFLISTQRWEGVPFYFRTGKRMKDKTARIDVVMRTDLSSPFGDSAQTNQNVLSLLLDPEKGWNFQWHEKQIGPGMELNIRNLSHLLSAEEVEDLPEAYEKLLLDALNGDPTHFAHWEEVASSWKLIDTIRNAWDSEQDSLLLYKTGTMGPERAVRLPENDGDTWVF